MLRGRFSNPHFGVFLIFAIIPFRNKGVAHPISLKVRKNVRERIRMPKLQLSFLFPITSIVHCLIVHSSFFIVHLSFFILHCSFVILHCSFVICHSSFFILHLSFVICHSSFFIVHCLIVHCLTPPPQTPHTFCDTARHPYTDSIPFW